MQHIVFSIKMHLNCKPVEIETVISAFISAFNSFEERGEVKCVLQPFRQFEDFIPSAACMWRALPMCVFSVIGFNQL